MTALNQLPLWCRTCESSYESFDERGICGHCGTPNVLERHMVRVTIPVDDYSYFDAQKRVQSIIDQLVQNQFISSETVVM